MVTQLQDILCKMASSGKNMSSSTFICRNEECRKVLYLEGRYLHKSRSRHPNKKKFKVLDHTVYISPGEIFETFVEFDDDLTMGNESYSKYLNLA